MTSPFVSVSELADALAGPTPPAVLDASLVLHAPNFDGDYRRDSGHPRWLAGHIPGSQHVDVASQFSDVSAPLHYTHPEPQAIADELARLGIAEGRAVVVYDSTGNLWAARLWYLLRWIGVPARVLDGGFAAWQAAGERVETGDAPRPEPVPSWRAEPARRAWVSKQELVERGRGMRARWCVDCLAARSRGPIRPATAGEVVSRGVSTSPAATSSRRTATSRVGSS